MNGQAAKATRREIRRAVGPSAIQTIGEQEQAIKWLVQQVNGLRSDVAEQAREGKLTREAGDAINRELRIHFGDAYAVFVRRLPLEDTFLGRLRWLFTGK